MAEKDEEPPARSFKVADRRRFADPDATDAGERAEDVAERTPDREPERSTAHDPPPIVGDAGAAPSGSQPSGQAAAGDAGDAGEMSFSTFVIGLTTQALMHLGEIADPLQQEVGRDLPAAKQMIDLLGILRDKTKGNLDQAEAQLLDTMLYDLRMRFVEVSRSR